MFVKIIKDSISPQGTRVTTLHARYWRAIHAELMTHRDMSRNARSSRAVPTITLLKEEIFVPQFGMNQPGMQSDILASPEIQAQAEAIWLDMADYCKEGVLKLNELGIHKQHCNRPLEWFGWIDVLITATRWNNFFALRISRFAQPEFDELAREIQRQMNLSIPQKLIPGQWHLPYVDSTERRGRSLEICQKLSVARCARLSYVPFDGEANLDKELERYNKLVVSQPVHASPAEHQATPDKLIDVGGSLDIHGTQGWARPELHGNFEGWIQYRKTIPNEVVR